MCEIWAVGLGSVYLFALFCFCDRCRSAQFVENAILFTWIAFISLSKYSWAYLFVWISFWVLNFVLSTYVSFPLPIPYCLNYCSYIIGHTNMLSNLPTFLLLFNSVTDILRSVNFHIKFRIILSISIRNKLYFDFGVDFIKHWQLFCVKSSNPPVI